MKPGQPLNCGLIDFRPTFHPEVLAAVHRLKKPRVIAWNFGGDAWCDGVDPEWRRKMWECINTDDKQWCTHVFLTKCPVSIGTKEAVNDVDIWLGVSITIGNGNALISQLWDAARKRNKLWASFEPVIGPLFVSAGWIHQHDLSFAVIGGLSDGAGRIVAPEDGGTRAEWVQPILDACHAAGVLIYLKNFRKSTLRQLTNPRTGKPIESMAELRDIPEEWRAVGS